MTVKDLLGSQVRKYDLDSHLGIRFEHECILDTVFDFSREPTIESITPSSGPVLGVFRVSIIGRRFQQADSLSCSIGGISNGVGHCMHVSAARQLALVPDVDACALSPLGVEFKKVVAGAGAPPDRDLGSDAANRHPASPLVASELGDIIRESSYVLLSV